MASPDVELRDHFVSDPDGKITDVITSGTNAFAGPEIPPSGLEGAGDEADKVVFCRLTGGPGPERTAGPTGVGFDLRNANVQVLVRGNRDEPEETRDFARELWDAADGATISGFLVSLCVQSEPTPLPPVEGRPRFFFDVELMHQHQR